LLYFDRIRHYSIYRKRVKATANRVMTYYVGSKVCLILQRKGQAQSKFMLQGRPAFSRKPFTLVAAMAVTAA
jgi:hypothetical protein